jgi:flagellar assembly protein FliH
MPAATKFSFDTTFDPPDPVTGHAQEQDAPPPEPTFRKKDLAAARAEGFEDGKQAGLAESNASVENAAAEALSRIAEQLASLGPACQAGLDRCRHETVGIAQAVARRTVERSARETALQVIENVLGDVLGRVIDEPRVVIRVHNDLLDPLQQRMYSVTDKCGFPGSVILLAEPGLQRPDCRIEWADGGAEFSNEAILAEIDALIDRYLAGVGADGLETDNGADAANPRENPDTTAPTEIDVEEQSNG